jgi:serine/threonine protein kinase
VKQQNDPSIGRVVLGRYRIVHGLARGGMGEIYLARSEGAAGFAKPVVIKRILSEFTTEDTVVQMFKREARIMSNLQHPGIVSVLDFGYEEGSYFMVLEYVHGLHAGRWRKFVTQTQQEFPVERAIQIAVCILEALHYAHTVKGPDGRELKIIHRDVSPSNVLIDVDGHVKLADFGIARMATNDAGEWKTSDLTVKGKFPYLPPEIFAGDQPAPHTDVYAVAVVLHEMIAGANEFRADSASATVGKVLSHVPRRLDELRSDVSAAVADVVAKGLAKKPSERWTTAQEMAQALRKARDFDSDEAVNEIAEAARRDFNDPRVVTVLGIEELASLEKAWRASAPKVPKPEGAPDVEIDIPLFASTRPPALTNSNPPAASSNAPTRIGITTTSGTGKTQIEDPGATRRPPQAGRAPLPAARKPEEAKKSVPWVLIMLGLVAVVGVGLGVFAVLRTPPAPQADNGPIYIVNGDNPTAAGRSDTRPEVGTCCGERNLLQIRA